MKRIENETYLDVNELATYLGLTETTIRNYIHNGKIQGQKIGKSWYAKESAIKAFFTPTTVKEEYSQNKVIVIAPLQHQLDSIQPSDTREAIKLMMQLILESPETNNITPQTFPEILKHVRAIAELIKNPDFEISPPIFSNTR